MKGFSPPRQIGMIGGTGLMGQMFAQLFSLRGFTVTISGPSPDPGYGGLVASSDMVVLCVPIAETIPVIERITPLLRGDQLLIDFTSIKAAPVEAMLATPACVIGCHPVFGPMATARGQNMVLCPVRPGVYLPWLRELFEAMGMTVVEMTPEAHDHAMAFVQGLTHFINILFAQTLNTQQANLQEILAVCSPIYRIFFAMMCRILSGDPALYGNIQIGNPENGAIIGDFLRNGSALEALLANQSLEGILKVFNESAGYLGDYKQIARQESDFLVRMMRDFGRDVAEE